jgi:hypothetical protein
MSLIEKLVEKKIITSEKAKELESKFKNPMRRKIFFF